MLYIYLHCLRRALKVIVLLFGTTSELAMGKAKNSVVQKKGSIGMLRLIAGKLQSSLSLFKRIREGHFVVIAAEGHEPKRFVIKLDHLNNPDFLKLLKQAEEEFGFSHGGPLELPCQPDELQRILSM